MPTAGIVFPGQGSQVVGMGVDIARAYPAARECFERASAVLGYDLLALCAHGPEEKLRETRTSQPAIFTTNVAIYRAVETLGHEPIASAGHSFGEYCSLTIADALPFEQAVLLVRERALAMGAAADLAPGGMAAIIGFEKQHVDEICARARERSGARVDIANLNAPTQIVVSGDTRAVEAAGDLAKAEGAKRVVHLSVSGAWHSELMAPAVQRFAQFVDAAEIRLPRFDVISNVEAEPYRSVDQIRRCLAASLRSRVRWHETALVISKYAPDVLVECGPSAVLAPMFKRISGAPQRCISVADTAGIAKLEKLASVPADV